MSKEHDFVEKVLEETRNGDLKWSWMLFDSLNGYCANRRVDNTSLRFYDNQFDSGFYISDSTTHIETKIETTKKQKKEFLKILQEINDQKTKDIIDRW